jgi:hypothetical protein
VRYWDIFYERSVRVTEEDLRANSLPVTEEGALELGNRWKEDQEEPYEIEEDEEDDDE